MANPLVSTPTAEDGAMGRTMGRNLNQNQKPKIKTNYPAQLLWFSPTQLM